jgi:NAD/NADP transhydrogenase beta subunit
VITAFIDVSRYLQVIVMKRSLGVGYAGKFSIVNNAYIHSLLLIVLLSHLHLVV